MSEFLAPEAAWLQSLPKVQLHVHLDGSVRLPTILDIAQQDGLDLGADSLEALAAKCQVTQPVSGLPALLDVFWVHQRVLNSYRNIRRVTFENIEDAWRDGVRLLELRFAPAFIAAGKPGLTNDEIISAVLDGVQEGMMAYPIEVGLIVITVRDLDLNTNRRALLDALRFRRSAHPMAERIVGFDLAASEAGTRPEDFVELVAMARAGGLGITVHSGEDTTAAHVQRTIEVLTPDRIGHGIQAWHDLAVVQLLKIKGIHLEVSITSNWLTRSVASLAAHPIRKLYDAGVSLSINTDDPHLMGIDLVHEYRLAQRLFGFELSDFERMNREALAHSFLPERLKEKVGLSG